MPRRTKDSEQELARISSVIAGLALTGTISLKSAANHLEVSPRTLQRRLNRFGINFWALVEQSRFRIAGALLRETDLQVREIAASLGYGTPSTFGRAFTKWAGRSPNAYRKAHTDGALRSGTMARNGQQRHVTERNLRR
ncbi:helix-turn-helix domain-containing protein [Roseibium salinum]|nr:helix-turn-helix transcriptional regulator [Roseibium salinum]